MADERTGFDSIELSLPGNAAYVTAARQTAVSIAGRLGFDADEVEDVKAAVAEACIYAIKMLASDISGCFKLVFIPLHDLLKIRITCPSREKCDLIGDYSLLLIKGLMEDFTISGEDGVIEMHMSKRHKDGFLEIGR